MAVLGKRKASASEEETAEEIFRRHFEAQFAPIESTPAKKRSTESSDEEDDSDSNDAGTKERRSRRDEDEGEDDEDDGWAGLSDEDDDEESDEEDEAIEVVDHSNSQAPKPAAMSKRELKAFMSSRAPSLDAKPNSLTSTPSTPSTPSGLPEDAPSLLAQDLELRRLISESHLLSSLNKSSTSSNNFSGADAMEPKLFATGRVRAKTTDLRVQALGSKDSVFSQKSMPMNMRKGIVGAAAERESKRRKQARENGVILEREAKPGRKRASGRSRDNGIDMPGMGRFRGAELKLNARDVKGIEGSRDVFGRKGGGRRR